MIWLAVVLLIVVGLVLAYTVVAAAGRADRRSAEMTADDLPDIDPAEWAAAAARIAAFREFLTEHPELLVLPRYEQLHDLYLTPNEEN